LFYLDDRDMKEIERVRRRIKSLKRFGDLGGLNKERQ
jgi:hypothetical protein